MNYKLVFICLISILFISISCIIYDSDSNMAQIHIDAQNYIGNTILSNENMSINYLSNIPAKDVLITI